MKIIGVALAVLVALVWIIAGNDRLFRSTVPIEQRLVSRNESIRKKAQQELLGLELELKRQAVIRLIPSLEKEDAFVRKWAAISMALVGPAAQDAIPSLLQCVSAKEKDVAQAARVALSEIGAPDAQQLPSLLRTIQDPRESVRCEAVLSIGKMGPAAQEAVPLLVNHMGRREESPVCFEQAIAALSASLPDTLTTVSELLSSGHVEIRRKAANVIALSSTRTPELIASWLAVLSREPDKIVRSRISQALGLPVTPEPNQLSVWDAALRARTVAVRLEAARDTRQNAPRNNQILPLVVRMLKDSEPSIRRLGLETLRRIGGARSTEILQRVGRAQRDEDPGVRCRAAETLIESGVPDRVSFPLLINDLRKDEDTARCAEVVLGLAGLFDNDVMRSMIRLVQDDENPDIRSRAARVLMHMGPRARESIPALQKAQKERIPGADMALRAVRTPIPRKRP